jgi:hypothetical protein
MHGIIQCGSFAFFVCLFFAFWSLNDHKILVIDINFLCKNKNIKIKRYKPQTLYCCRILFISLSHYTILFLWWSIPSHSIKVILLADSIRLRLLSWFGSPIIKKIPEYHPPNVYGYVEMWMFIMSKHSTIPNCSKFDFRNDDRYKDILLSLNYSQAFIAQSVTRWIFDPDVRGLYPVSARIFAFLLSCIFFCTFKWSFILIYYETFYYLTWKCKHITNQCW